MGNPTNPDNPTTHDNPDNHDNLITVITLGSWILRRHRVMPASVRSRAARSIPYPQVPILGSLAHRMMRVIVWNCYVDTV